MNIMLNSSFVINEWMKILYSMMLCINISKKEDKVLDWENRAAAIKGKI